MDSQQVPINLNGQTVHINLDTLNRFLHFVENHSMQHEEEKSQSEDSLLETDEWIAMLDLVKSHRKICESFSKLINRR